VQRCYAVTRKNGKTLFGTLATRQQVLNEGTGGEVYSKKNFLDFWCNSVTNGFFASKSLVSLVLFVTPLRVTARNSA